MMYEQICLIEKREIHRQQFCFGNSPLLLLPSFKAVSMATKKKVYQFVTHYVECDQFATPSVNALQYTTIPRVGAKTRHTIFI